MSQAQSDRSTNFPCRCGRCSHPGQYVWHSAGQLPTPRASDANSPELNVLRPKPGHYIRLNELFPPPLAWSDTQARRPFRAAYVPPHLRSTNEWHRNFFRPNAPTYVEFAFDGLTYVCENVCSNFSELTVPLVPQRRRRTWPRNVVDRTKAAAGRNAALRRTSPSTLPMPNAAAK